MFNLLVPPRPAFAKRLVGRAIRRCDIGMLMASAAVLLLTLAIVACQSTWHVEAAAFIVMGWSFYMLHRSLQVFSGRLSLEARVTALWLHAFSFLMGQTPGPIAFSFGRLQPGRLPALMAVAAVVIALGFLCSRLLQQRTGSADRSRTTPSPDRRKANVK